MYHTRHNSQYTFEKVFIFNTQPTKYVYVIAFQGCDANNNTDFIGKIHISVCDMDRVHVTYNMLWNKHIDLRSYRPLCLNNPSPLLYR